MITNIFAAAYSLQQLRELGLGFMNPDGDHIRSSNLDVKQSPIRRRLDAVELGVGSASGHEFIVLADLDDMGTVENHDEIGHAHGGKAVGDEKGDAAVVLGCAIRGR